jgi:hypothetical protein
LQKIYDTINKQRDMYDQQLRTIVVPDKDSRTTKLIIQVYMETLRTHVTNLSELEARRVTNELLQQHKCMENVHEINKIWSGIIGDSKEIHKQMEKYQGYFKKNVNLILNALAYKCMTPIETNHGTNRGYSDDKDSALMMTQFVEFMINLHLCHALSGEILEKCRASNTGLLEQCTATLAKKEAAVTEYYKLAVIQMKHEAFHMGEICGIDASPLLQKISNINSGTLNDVMTSIGSVVKKIHPDKLLGTFEYRRTSYDATDGGEISHVPVTISIGSASDLFEFLVQFNTDCEHRITAEKHSGVQLHQYVVCMDSIAKDGVVTNLLNLHMVTIMLFYKKQSFTALCSLMKELKDNDAMLVDIGDTLVTKFEVTGAAVMSIYPGYTSVDGSFDDRVKVLLKMLKNAAESTAKAEKLPSDLVGV